jgi:nucleoside-diphosphate-sugar epimerase
VVVTGAAGSIERAVSPSLGPLWDLCLTDAAPGAGTVLDVTDQEACRTAFSGADAVVHLASVSDPAASGRSCSRPT